MDIIYDRKVIRNKRETRTISRTKSLKHRYKNQESLLCHFRVYGLTGGGISYKQGDEVGDGRLAFSEAVKATGRELLGLLSRWQLVQGQVVLLFKELSGTRGEP